MLQNSLVGELCTAFREKTSIKSNTEALFYLESTNMDLAAAYVQWEQDVVWEKEHTPPNEKYDFFDPSSSTSYLTFSKNRKKNFARSRRGCCMYVFGF